jgi:BirA family biotin operon repressor/biotin-[acetyl-CoA-carboxylase] ligase
LRSTDRPAPTLSLVAGLALIEALDVALPGQPLMLKWPNDLMLSGVKLAGILAERSGDHVVLGFGVNLASSPDLINRQAASLHGQVQPEAFAPLLAGSFSRMLTAWRSSELPGLIRAWEERANPLGTTLAVTLNYDEQISGCFGGLDSGGALRLLRDDGSVELIHAGDIEL